MLTVARIPIAIIDQSPDAAIPLLVGLFILFVSKSNREDERAIIIKTSSAYIALIMSYGIQLVTTNLYGRGLISIQLTEINYFLILLFTFANLIYYLRLYIFLK